MGPLSGIAPTCNESVGRKKVARALGYLLGGYFSMAFLTMSSNFFEFGRDRSSLLRQCRARPWNEPWYRGDQSPACPRRTALLPSACPIRASLRERPQA